MRAAKILLGLGALFLSGTIAARGETYTIDPAHSRIGFHLRHLLGTARGEFHQFRGTIEFDPKQPERSSVVVQIQVASIDTKIEKRDEHLRSADFFDAEKFPEIVFRSRSVKQTSADTGEISGELTMHGVTRPITLRVKLAPAKAAAAGTRWSVTTNPIQRKEFGLAFSPTAEAVSGVSAEVSPEIEIEAVVKE